MVRSASHRLVSSGAGALGEGGIRRTSLDADEMGYALQLATRCRSIWQDSPISAPLKTNRLEDVLVILLFTR